MMMYCGFLERGTSELQSAHTPIQNKCMDISQQTGSKRKSVSEIKNI